MAREKGPYLEDICDRDNGTEYECETCGYNEWDSLLEFHHVKDGHMLLCAPCHRSYHPGELERYAVRAKRFKGNEEVFQALSNALRRHGCDGGHSEVRRYYQAKGFTRPALRGALLWFQKTGGFCDCEVHLNVILKYIAGKTTAEVIHLARGLANV